MAAMRLPAKICGLSTPETVEAAVAGGAGCLGFHCFPPSPRLLELEAAAGPPAPPGAAGVRPSAPPVRAASTPVRRYSRRLGVLLYSPTS